MAPVIATASGPGRRRRPLHPEALPQPGRAAAGYCARFVARTRRRLSRRARSRAKSGRTCIRSISAFTRTDFSWPGTSSATPERTSTRAGRQPIENNDLLWPETEGREEAWNRPLSDAAHRQDGSEWNISIDATGKKVSEMVAAPATVAGRYRGHHAGCGTPAPLHREQVLAKNAKRGAIVIIDPNNGDILAMASLSCVFSRNSLQAQRSPKTVTKPLSGRPGDSPSCRAPTCSPYPPGSTFKVVIGIAALESGAISLHEDFGCPRLAADRQHAHLVEEDGRRPDRFP